MWGDVRLTNCVVIDVVPSRRALALLQTQRTRKLLSSLRDGYQLSAGVFRRSLQGTTSTAAQLVRRRVIENMEVVEWQGYIHWWRMI